MDKPKDKIFLIALIKNLNASVARIRKDECGDYYFPCKEGKIFTVGPVWYIYFNPNSKRRWTFFKQKLNFLKVHQDGDEEGILSADFPVSVEQAILIRKLLKVRKAKHLSEEEKRLLKIRLNSSSK